MRWKKFNWALIKLGFESNCKPCGFVLQLDKYRINFKQCSLKGLIYFHFCKLFRLCLSKYKINVSICMLSTKYSSIVCQFSNGIKMKKTFRGFLWRSWTYCGRKVGRTSEFGVVFLPKQISSFWWALWECTEDVPLKSTQLPIMQCNAMDSRFLQFYIIYSVYQVHISNPSLYFLWH